MDDYEKILVEETFMGDRELPATVLRLPMVYGERDVQHRLFLELKRMDDGRPVIILEEGVSRWCSTRGYVENVAAAITLAVIDERAAGRIYNVGERDALSYAEWVRAIGRAASWEGKVVIVPNGRLPAKLRPPTGNYDQHLIANTSRIHEELGCKDAIPRDEALRRTVAWERTYQPEGNPKLFDYEAEDAVLAQLRREGI